VPGLWLCVLLTGGPGPVSASGIALFVLAGLVGTAGGRLLRFLSIERVGASISSALVNLSPLVSSALAVVLLGERVTAPIAAGTAVIVAGTIVLSAGGRRIGVRPAQLVLPLLSAACFGVVSVLRKLGLGGAGPVVGTAVNASAALVAFTAFLLASGQREVMVCRGRGLLHFVIAGIMENAAVLLTIMALGVGAVSVVLPLTGTAPVFVLLLSAVFLRGVEVLNGRVVLGTLLIVAGVYLITALGGS
jgi:uncharacterized membrane protein